MGVRNVSLKWKWLSSDTSRRKYYCSTAVLLCKSSFNITLWGFWKNEYDVGGFVPEDGAEDDNAPSSRWRVENFSPLNSMEDCGRETEVTFTPKADLSTNPETCEVLCPLNTRKTCWKKILFTVCGKHSTRYTLISSLKGSKRTTSFFFSKLLWKSRFFIDQNWIRIRFTSAFDFAFHTVIQKQIYQKRQKLDLCHIQQTSLSSHVQCVQTIQQPVEFKSLKTTRKCTFVWGWCMLT